MRRKIGSIDALLPQEGYVVIDESRGKTKRTKNSAEFTPEDLEFRDLYNLWKPEVFSFQGEFFDVDLKQHWADLVRSYEKVLELQDSMDRFREWANKINDTVGYGTSIYFATSGGQPTRFVDENDDKILETIYIYKVQLKGKRHVEGKKYTGRNIDNEEYIDVLTKRGCSSEMLWKLRAVLVQVEQFNFDIRMATADVKERFAKYMAIRQLGQSHMRPNWYKYQPITPPSK